MSRIGKAPIPLPDSVDFKYDNAVVTVKGPKGELTQRVPREMMVEVGDGVIQVKRPTDSGQHRSLHGLTRTLIANMVTGVTDGFEKRLEIVGVGYRASVKGDALELLVGYSHPVVIEPPEHITFETPAADRGRRAGASTSRSSARSPPRCAPSGRPSPTRARVSGTPASTSSARSASAPSAA